MAKTFAKHTRVSRNLLPTWVRGSVLPLLLGCLCGSAMAQGSLGLDSATVPQGGTANLNLNLSSSAGNQPAAIQWTLTYSPSDIISINVIAGGSATAAGKSITCNPSAGSVPCIIAGLNSTVMQNGVAAIVTVTLAPTVASTSIGVA